MFYIDNFETGQSTVVPSAPRTRRQMEDFRRADYYIGEVFSHEEVSRLGLEGRRNWILPA
ncbi:MAG: hypothetical protein KGH63_00855 [Candidatus Micrarchaeota archaeon]|nr:hypothetical protein [Candidatus Micrarchaeota archaeon]